MWAPLGTTGTTNWNYFDDDKNKNLKTDESNEKGSTIKKFLFEPSNNIWHFMYDFLAQVIWIGKNEGYENTEFIIYFPKRINHTDNLISFLKDFFEKHGVKNYYFASAEDLMLINDYYRVNTKRHPTYPAHNLIYETLLKHYPSDIKPPEKKVYVSRINTKIKRIDDEKIIEDFFASKGFEIFNKLDFGKSDILEDIKYFRDVKVIAGISGAGLVNAVFMQPGNLLIEIAVPLITHIPGKEDHYPYEHDSARHLFHPLSAFIKNHMLIQVPVNDNSAKNAVDKINNLGIL
jgi:hypothetical protein